MIELVPTGSFTPGFENGMSAVHKDAARDRLVLDSRASNMLDPGQSIWCKSIWPLLQFLGTSRSMTLRFCWQVEKI